MTPGAGEGVRREGAAAVTSATKCVASSSTTSARSSAQDLWAADCTGTCHVAFEELLLHLGTLHSLYIRVMPHISHRCEDPCHRGNCHSCPHVSFDELSCHCGEKTLFPPVPCGTRPPECANRCARSHDCDHAVMHNCHSEERCPPCAALTERRCYGGHEVRARRAHQTRSSK